MLREQPLHLGDVRVELLLLLRRRSRRVALRDQLGHRQLQSEEDTTDRVTKVAKEPDFCHYQKMSNENAHMRRLLQKPSTLKQYLHGPEGTNAPEQGKKDHIEDVITGATDPATMQVNAYKPASGMEARRMARMEQRQQRFARNFSSQELARSLYVNDLTRVRGQHP